MNEQQKFGMVWYEPGQNFAYWTGEHFLDSKGLVLDSPEDYDYGSDGFFAL